MFNNFLQSTVAQLLRLLKVIGPIWLIYRGIRWSRRRRQDGVDNVVDSEPHDRDHLRPAGHQHQLLQVQPGMWLGNCCL